MDGLILILDIIGTAAFGASGAMKGIRKRMDIFGIFILTLVTACGGGMTRDVLLDRGVPVFFKTSLYIIIVLIVWAIAIIFKNQIFKISGFINVCDAIGLALFVINSGNALINEGYNFIAVCGGSVISAVGGGVIRDILCGEKPGILSRELYASVGILGITLFYLMHSFTPFISIEIRIIIGLLFIFVFRLIAIHYDWNLPVPKLKYSMVAQHELDDEYDNLKDRY